jgi:enterochelin esterase family protein
LRDSLLDKGCEVSWRQWHEGHSWGSWRAHLDITLEYFFPGDSISVKVHDIREFPLEYALFQNYPNPFNPSTKISWQSPKPGLQVIKVFDILGNEVKTLVNEEKEAGYHSIDFNASNLPSGVYFYQLKADEFISTKKMLLLK